MPDISRSSCARPIPTASAPRQPIEKAPKNTSATDPAKPFPIRAPAASFSFAASAGAASASASTNACAFPRAEDRPFACWRHAALIVNRTGHMIQVRYGGVALRHVAG
jgi:hypothetical protein